MLLHRLDARAGLALWYFFGAENSDADFERYVASIEELERELGPTRRGTGLMLVDRENPAPNARWRKRMAEVSAHIGGNALFVLVSDSLAIRGVATAINWLRPPLYEFRAFPSVEEGFAWVERRRDAATAERMRTELAELRAEATRMRGELPR